MQSPGTSIEIKHWPAKLVVSARFLQEAEIFSTVNKVLRHTALPTYPNSTV